MSCRFLSLVPDPLDLPLPHRLTRLRRGRLEGQRLVGGLINDDNWEVGPGGFKLDREVDGILEKKRNIVSTREAATVT